MFELNSFESIKINLASPEKIREWSYGEVTKPETINYRTQKPEVDGLFCERIFGPRKDLECHCGKYKRIRYKGIICDKCGVEVTRAKVRRERMGHIELAAPVSHIWFFRSVPTRIGTLLDLTSKALEKVLYYVNYIVTKPMNSNFEYKQIISDKEYRDAIEEFGANSFEAKMGAEAIKQLLGEIDLAKDSKELRDQLVSAKGQKRLKAIKKLEIVESFLRSGNDPRWMILEALPVLPPELRPMIQLDGGRFTTSDLNDLYRRVINRNNRLKKLMELGAPDVIIRNEKRMLQEAVDALIENGKRGRAVQGVKNRELKSLTSILAGKQGRFRQHLLGKRVDYSGRSVIVVGPELKMYQCGIPKEMALELFKPFIMKRLCEINEAQNISFRSAKRMIEKETDVVWDILAEVIKDHPVLLNRAPTLHRLGIQAFEPILVEGRAIKLHPSVCTGFNADFDGDQMPVHVPLSIDARTEARTLMLASNNILNLSSGSSIVSPGLDIVLGCFYLTTTREGKKGEGMIFATEDEAIFAHDAGIVDLQAKISLRRNFEIKGEKFSKIIQTTVGLIIFNRAIPQNLGFVDRNDEKVAANFEISTQQGKGELAKLVEKTFKILGTTATSNLIDNLKSLGYKHATNAGLTINAFDMKVNPQKDAIVAESEEKVLENEKLFRRGIITLEEKTNSNISVWNEASVRIMDEAFNYLDETNPLKMMVKSKARGTKSQLNQMIGFRGIMSNSSGQKVDIPVKSCFRSGLTPIEYFLSSRGGRKGLADRSLQTADAGYLTRRLVDVSHSAVISEDDCFASAGEKVKGMKVSAIMEDKVVYESLQDRITGRVAVEKVVHPVTSKTIIKEGDLITREQAQSVENAGIKEVTIRSVLTCKAKNGICAKCYGKNMANNELVNIGEAVGIIAAQSIGEPGTQLTMRTFQSGGVAVAADITKGLPRVEEIFEAKKPKGEALLSEVSGKVSIKEEAKEFVITVKSSDGEVEYVAKKPTVLKVKNGETIEAGKQLNIGSVNPNDLLRIVGVKGVQDYLLKEVISVYCSNDVKINDKHLEIIISQMLKKVKVENSGGTDLLPGSVVEIQKLEEENLKAISNGLMPASSKRILLSITKASLTTESFLSAASFQESSRVLTDASIKGKTDYLKGLKENVIIGKLIPAGTGLKEYRSAIPVEVG